MRKLGQIIFVLAAIAVFQLTSSFAQQSQTLKDEIVAAYADARAASDLVRQDLSELFESIPNWNCRERKLDFEEYYALPLIAMRCEHSDISLRVWLKLDPDKAEKICSSINAKRSVRNSKPDEPDLSRYFAQDNWKAMRSSVNLTGCTASGIALSARGVRTERAILVGQNAVDGFIDALLARDLSQVEKTIREAGHSAIQIRLRQLLEAQSIELGDTISALDGWTKADQQTGSHEGFAPSVRTIFKTQNCRIRVELSGGSALIHDATVNKSFLVYQHGEDGKRSSAFVRRNTKRILGRERLDGTGIEVILDGAVYVWVRTLDRQLCEAHPAALAVNKIFESLLVHDFTKFGAQ